jgi:hypothetical protein
MNKVVLNFTALLNDALAFSNVLAHGGGDTHGDHAKVGNGVHCWRNGVRLEEVVGRMSLCGAGKKKRGRRDRASGLAEEQTE